MQLDSKLEDGDATVHKRSTQRWGSNPCERSTEDRSVLDYNIPSKSRTMNLMRLSLLSYPSCNQRYQYGWGCGYPIETMSDIFETNRSIFGPQVKNQEQENAASQDLHDACWDWLIAENEKNGGHFSNISVPADTAEFEYGVQAFEWELPQANTTVLVFRGTFSRGDYANIENWMIDYILEKSTDRMKEAWIEDAGLPWSDEMQQRSTDDRLEKLLIRAGESFILGQARPLKEEGDNTKSVAQELSASVAQNATLSKAIGGLTTREALSTGYWKLTKFVVDQVAARVVAKNHTLVLTGHSQGGTRAQLASMYLHQSTGVAHPTVTFAATGSSCVARLLFDSNANLLDDVNPFIVHEHLVDYTHPLDCWGNTMLGEDNGSTCFWGKQEQEQDPSSYRYCSRIYGWTGPTLIAADADLIDNQELKDNFQRCRYFTHTTEAILMSLQSDLLDDGTTKSGCRAAQQVPRDDPQHKCPAGNITSDELYLILAIVMFFSIAVLLCLACIYYSRRCCRIRSRATQHGVKHSLILQVDNEQDDNMPQFELPSLS